MQLMPLWPQEKQAMSNATRICAAICAVGLVAITAGAREARADIVYSSIPASLPTNLPSVGYESTSISQFGDAVTLAGSARVLTSATVVMSNWALESTYETVGTSSGYYEPLTFSLYNFGTGGLNPVVGSLIASTTINAFIPWRPEASLSCGGTTFQAPDGCFNGLAVPVTFNFDDVVLPDNVIFGLSFNTADYGASPTHAAGPYNSLNFALSAGATVGTDTNSDGVELATGIAGVFGPDTGWSPYVPAVTLEAIPEPVSAALLLPALFGLATTRWRRRSSV
jgi:hypothetical protein